MFLTLKILKMIRESKAEEWSKLFTNNHLMLEAKGTFLVRGKDVIWFPNKGRTIRGIFSWLIKRALNKKLLEKKKVIIPCPHGPCLV